MAPDDVGGLTVDAMLSVRVTDLNDMDEEDDIVVSLSLLELL